jgi:hypothetical protein
MARRICGVYEHSVYRLDVEQALGTKYVPLTIDDPAYTYEPMT